MTHVSPKRERMLSSVFFSFLLPEKDAEFNNNNSPFVLLLRWCLTASSSVLDYCHRVVKCDSS